MSRIAKECSASNANAANSMTKEDIEALNGECHYCVAGKVGDCLCTKGYGAWYGNPDPATHTLKQIRQNGELVWVPVSTPDPAPTPNPTLRRWLERLFG